MDINKLQDTLTNLLKKYRYVILVLAIGLALMLLPSGKENVANDKSTQQVQIQNVSVGDQLAEILGDIEGAGKVEVMLTEATGEERIYQTDEERTESENESDISIKTVIVTDSEKNETALVRQINPPRYLGAIVICQGADSASVRLAVVDAVSKITGLGSDCISVLKMK